MIFYLRDPTRTCIVVLVLLYDRMEFGLEGAREVVFKITTFWVTLACTVTMKLQRMLGNDKVSAK